MKKSLLFIIISFYAAFGYCQTFTAIANGNFESAATWSPGGGPPGAGASFVIPSGFNVTVTTNYTPLLGNGSIAGTLTFNNGSKLNFGVTSTVLISTGGLITGGNGGSTMIFPAITYAGPFNQAGPYYYTNSGSGAGTLALTDARLTYSLANSNIQLSWLASADQNTLRYELEWSSSAIGNWQRVNSQEVITGLSTYQYLHSTTAPTNYYRIKTVSRDGSFAFSPAITVTRMNAEPVVILPAGSSTLTCRVPNTKLYTVAISDINGRVVKQQSLQGSYTYGIDVSTFNSGVYFVQFNQDGLSKTLRVAKH